MVNFVQVTKSIRGMPWHMKLMKDVGSCEKLREGANSRGSGDLRIGKPTGKPVTLAEYIG